MVSQTMSLDMYINSHHRDQKQNSRSIYHLFSFFLIFSLWIKRSSRINSTEDDSLTKSNCSSLKREHERCQNKAIDKDQGTCFETNTFLFSLFIVNPKNWKNIFSQKYEVVSKNHSFWQNNLLYVKDPLSNKWFHYSDYGILKHGFEAF